MAAAASDQLGLPETLGLEVGDHLAAGFDPQPRLADVVDERDQGRNTRLRGVRRPAVEADGGEGGTLVGGDGARRLVGVTDEKNAVERARVAQELFQRSAHGSGEDVALVHDPDQTRVAARFPLEALFQEVEGTLRFGAGNAEVVREVAAEAQGRDR